MNPGCVKTILLLSFLSRIAVREDSECSDCVRKIQHRLYRFHPFLLRCNPKPYPAQALRKVLIPALRPGMISGFILSFTMSLDDFAVTFFTRGTIGLDTLSTYIYTDARKGGLTPELKPLMTILFLVILVVLLVINIRQSKNSDKK